jgi:hypothetical protein
MQPTRGCFNGRKRRMDLILQMFDFADVRCAPWARGETMSSEKGLSNPREGELRNQPKQNQISKIGKKGTTLGAQHASHGDTGRSGKSPRSGGKKSSNRK